MNKKVLLFNIPSKEERMKINMALLPLKIAVRAIPKEEYNQSMGYLYGDKQLEEVDGIYDGEELDGSLMLLCGISREELEKIIRAFKKQGAAKDCLKAVLTETNRTWDVLKLYKQIKSEHEMMTGKA